MKSHENYEISIETAKKELQTANQLVCITYPVIKDQRLMSKILEHLYACMVSIVKAVLQYEYLYKRIEVYSDSKSNFETFGECASRFNISPREVGIIQNILNLMEKHKNSSMEFVRREKYVMMSDSLRTEIMTFDLLKSYLLLAKDILPRVENSLKSALL